MSMLRVERSARGAIQLRWPFRFFGTCFVSRKIWRRISPRLCANRRAFGHFIQIAPYLFSSCLIRFYLSCKSAFSQAASGFDNFRVMRALPALGTVRIPIDMAIAARDEALGGIPAAPAMRMAEDDDLPLQIFAGERRNPRFEHCREGRVGIFAGCSDEPRGGMVLEALTGGPQPR